MPWFVSLALDAPVTPADQATSSITGLILGYGPLGAIALAMAYLIFKGWRLIPPDKEAAGREAARAEARADLLEERARVLSEKTRIEHERDEAQQFATSQLVPLLINFTNATGALIPLLQELVRHREAGDFDARRRNR